jgi:hypothetical protein
MATTGNSCFWLAYFLKSSLKLMQISMFFADWLVYSEITLVFKFQAVWTTSYQAYNHKHELPVVAMFVNGSGRNEQSL